VGLAAASHTQRISTDLFLHRFSASLRVKTAGKELALVCGEGAVAMEITDEAESILERSFQSRQSIAREFPPEEQAELILRLFGGVDASDKEDAIDQRRFSEDAHEQIFALYDEYRPRLFGYLRSLHLRREEAEEVIQETFLQLTTALVRKTGIDNVQGWIFRVTHNLAVDVIKRKERDSGHVLDVISCEFESVRDKKSSPEETLLKKEQQQQMETALERFGPLQRQCFHMRAQGVRYKDIGLALGISTQRVALVVQQVTARLAAICG
jgi:RNA polymerase sigma-70 factor (ECF subfamily)